VANDDPVALFKSGFGMLYTALGAVGLVTGLVNASMIAALNTIGVIGIVVLLVAYAVAEFNADKPDVQRVKNTVAGTAIGGTIITVLWFAFARPLDAEERQFSILSFLGIGVLLVAFMSIAYAKELVAPKMKKCPDCANEVLAEARKCQHCQHRFDEPAST
jgi:hypothetical protein